MAKIVHINCPKCGGTLGMAGAERVVKCRYCGTWSLVDAPDVVPEYSVKPKLDETSARRALQHVLMDPEMPRGLLQHTRFHSARLYFIPYHELAAHRLGTMTTTELPRYQDARRSLSPYDSMGPARGNYEPLPHFQRLAPQPSVDTRVIMSDVSRLEPAVKLPEWALDEAELGRLRSAPEGTLQPANRQAMEKIGKVYSPTISPAQLIAQCNQKVGAASLQDHTEIAEPRVKRIFYPIWRARYSYQGRLYGATVDGVTGKMLSVRAPQDDRTRVLWLLGAAAPVSFIAGKIVKLVLGYLLAHGGKDAGILLLVGIQFSHVLIPLIFFGAMGALLLLGMGWDQFRYPGELVIRGRERTVEKIGRPPQTGFDKALAKMSAIMEGAIENARRRRS